MVAGVAVVYENLLQYTLMAGNLAIGFRCEIFRIGLHDAFPESYPQLVSRFLQIF